MSKSAFQILSVISVTVLALACGSSNGGGTGGSGSGSGGATSSGGGTGTGSGGHGGSASGSGGAGEETPLHMACKAFCMAEDSCKVETTVEDCMSYTCPPAGDPNSHEGLSQTCKNAYIAYWNCIRMQANVCDRPGNCETQGMAVADCS